MYKKGETRISQESRKPSTQQCVQQTPKNTVSYEKLVTQSDTLTTDSTTLLNSKKYGREKREHFNALLGEMTVLLCETNVLSSDERTRDYDEQWQLIFIALKLA